MERIEKLQAFLAKQPTDSFLRHALALEYVKLGDDVEARQQFETLLENEPGYVGSYYHLGKLLERAGEYKAAIEVYEKGIVMAQAAKDFHAKGELQMALEEIVD